MAASIVWTLKENERNMNQELVLTRALGEKLQARAKSLREKKMKRPVVGEHQVEEELKRLHYQISTGSLNLKEEKQLMKEIAGVKSARRDHVAVDAHREQVQQASTKADEAYAKVNRLYDALSEIRSAIRQFELCAKIEALHSDGRVVTPGDLEVKLIDVLDTSVLGQIIGRKGVGVERLRAKHCIEFDTMGEGETTQIKLTGLPEGIVTATVAIQSVLNSISKDLEVTTELISALLHNKAERLHKFGEKHFCTVEPKRENGTYGTVLSIRGLEDGVAACSADLLSFQNSASEVSVADELIPKVVGSKASVLTQLQQEHGVYINIDRKNLVFRIYHENDGPKQTVVDILTQSIDDFTQHDDEFAINPLMASKLIGKGGETIKQLQKEAKCLVTVDRENRSRVILRGTRKSLEFAKEQLQQISELYAKEHQDVQFSPTLVGILLHNNGETIKELEKEHEVRINVKRDTGNISIAGKEEHIANAKTALAALQESSTVETITGLTSSEIREIIGKNGESIKSLTKEHKCDIKIQKAVNDVTVQGLSGNVAQCKSSIMAIVEKFRRENIEMTVDPMFLPSFIGKDGESIKKFRKSYKGLDINLGPRGSGIVKLHGAEELIQQVQQAIKEACELYIATNVDLTVMKKQINLLIGHRGETIKQLQKDSGCSIDIRKNNTDNKVKVRGETAEAVQKAIQMIRDIIGTEWETKRIPLPTATAAAYVVGKKGETIQRLQKDNGCVVEINQKDNHVEISGSKECCERVGLEINNILDENIIYYKRIVIDEKYISSIIGRGGSNIRQMQEESGADLNVLRPSTGINGNQSNKNRSRKNNYNRRNRDENPIDANDENNTVNEEVCYMVVRGNKTKIQKGIAMMINAIAELRLDQMVLKPQHMASLKQQQSTQFVAMELRFNVNIVLDMERNTVTLQLKDASQQSLDDFAFSNKSNKSNKSKKSKKNYYSQTAQSPQNFKILQARMQIHNLLHFFYPKEFVKIEMPLEMSSALDRDLLPKHRIESGARMTLVNSSSSCVVLIYGDEIQTNAGIELLKQVKKEYMKTARDVMLHSEMIGGIVGKGGSGIRALEKQFQVKISTDKTIPGLVHLRVQLAGGGNKNGKKGNSKGGDGGDGGEGKDDDEQKQDAETAATTDATRILDEAEKFFLQMKKEYESTFTSFEFDSEATSIIIGKGGASIRKLQDDHNVRIDINSNTPGVANIRSSLPENLVAAVEALKELLSENGYGDDIETIDMDVMRQHVGAIVGEGGSVIRKLESDSNAQIKIHKTDNGGVVTIRGRPEAIAIAKKDIETICTNQEEEYANKKAAMKKEQEEERETKLAKQQQQQTQSTNDSAEAQENDEETNAPRNIPGMSAEWNQKSAEGHSMSAQAQKNRRKRERRKAAGKGSGSNKAAAKEEHYQQDLEQLLFMGGPGGGGGGSGGSGGSGTATHINNNGINNNGINNTPISSMVQQTIKPSSSSSWNPPPPSNRQPPPGFGSSTQSQNTRKASVIFREKVRVGSTLVQNSSVSRSPPPGFSPVPKNHRKRPQFGQSNEEIDATMSKLADLGFSNSMGGQTNYDYANVNSTTTAGAAQTKKKYVSARGGYKLRL